MGNLKKSNLLALKFGLYWCIERYSREEEDSGVICKNHSTFACTTGNLFCVTESVRGFATISMTGPVPEAGAKARLLSSRFLTCSIIG